MFGSQALETAIGLAMMFFVIATAASMIHETISRVFQKRAKDLERAIGAMLAAKRRDADSNLSQDQQRAQKEHDDGLVQEALEAFKKTSVYQAAAGAAGKSLFRRNPRIPSYLSSKAFADATVEMLTDTDRAGQAVLKRLEDLPPNLRDRITPLVKEAKDDVVAFKAGLERWFDDTMDRAEGSYKRWTTLVLFGIGLVIAIGGNASTVNVAQKLYVSSVARDAVVDAADKVVADTVAANSAGSDGSGTPAALAGGEGSEGSETPPTVAETNFTQISDATAKLKELQLPVGWGPDNDDFVVHLKDGNLDRGDWGTLAGWLLTALLVMLGAPFWFDLLSKLVALRTSGGKPDTAANDPSSSTRLQLAATRAAPAGTAAGPATELAKEPVVVPKTNDEVAVRLAGMLGAAPPDVVTTTEPASSRTRSVAGDPNEHLSWPQRVRGWLWKVCGWLQTS